MIYCTYHSEGCRGLLASDAACVHASVLHSQFPDFELLSGTFTVEGVSPTLCDLICIFSPGHWGIVARE